MSDYPAYPNDKDLFQDGKASDLSHDGRVKVLVVSGAFAADGTIRDVKVRAKSLSRRQISLPSVGTYGLEMRTDKGVYGVIGFEPYMISGNRKPNRGFNLVAPYTDKLTKLVIRQGKNVLFTKNDGPTNLDIVLSVGEGKSKWGKSTATIRWKVIGDVSKAAEQIVEFSPDLGLTWHPIAALSGDRRDITINPKNVPASKRAHRHISIRWNDRPAR
jgi:hypothetical protein